MQIVWKKSENEIEIESEILTSDRCTIYVCLWIEIDLLNTRWNRCKEK